MKDLLLGIGIGLSSGLAIGNIAVDKAHAESTKSSEEYKAHLRVKDKAIVREMFEHNADLSSCLGSLQKANATIKRIIQ